MVMEECRQQIERYNAPNSSYGNGIRSMQDLTSYSGSHASTVQQEQAQEHNNVRFKTKKGKPANNGSAKTWSLNDPELQRKKRVAGYKAYAVEGRVKGSINKSFRWLKDRCSIWMVVRFVACCILYTLLLSY
ncbi:hypothetical protein V6N13_097967 [Hibiscus sabdariffa]|uniref:Uncharacterized protein n=1 Tax=Hibiscus sabdariffa TaxID=183260 RepID=A0ABR2NV45_9ROSI